MDKETLNIILKMNMNIQGYRAIIVVPSQFEIEKYVQKLCTNPNIRFNKMDNEIKHILNDSRIRFVLPSVREERVKGLRLQHVFLECIPNDNLLTHLKSRVNNDCMLFIE